jgi:uncharacterized membrane protein YhhN
MLTLHKIKLITKPFWIPAITGIYLLLTASVDPLIITALCFGYIGDLLLMRPRKTWFIAGALSFLVGHLFYISVFIINSGGPAVFFYHPAASIFMLIPYIIFAVLFKKYIGHNVSSVFYPAAFYLSVLLLMSYSSLLRVWNVPALSFILTFTGSILFIISDSLIGVRKLKAKFKGIGTLIVVTYLAAQILIIVGITTG